MKRPLLYSSDENNQNLCKKICNQSLLKILVYDCAKTNSVHFQKCRKRKNDDESQQESKSKRFKFERVCGVKKNSKCIYVSRQKLMYVQNNKNKFGQKTYICYNYKKQKCLSRMVEISENICQPTVNSKPHTCVGNHEQFLTNCKLLRDIKNRALEVNKICGTEAFKISAQAIIDQEKSRY